MDLDVIRRWNIMSKILIVEDDKALNNGIAFNLQFDGLEVEQAYNLSEAKRIIDNNEIDLIIQDVNLPDGSGFNFCKEIRKNYDMPIVFLTARDMELDEITGFKVGGDDYITKPFNLTILRERILSKLRRYKRLDSKINSITQGIFTLDLDKLALSKDSENIVLAPTEYKLIKKLMENKGKVLTRNALLEELWDKDSEFVEEHALTVNINRLRSKIEENSSKPKYIKTVYGMGYMWCVEDE